MITQAGEWRVLLCTEGRGLDTGVGAGVQLSGRGAGRVGRQRAGGGDSWGPLPIHCSKCSLCSYNGGTTGWWSCLGGCEILP